MANIIALKEISDRKPKPVPGGAVGDFQLLFFTGVRYEHQIASAPAKPALKRISKLSLKKA